MSNSAITEELIHIICNYLTIDYVIVAFHLQISLLTHILSWWSSGIFAKLPRQSPATTQGGTSQLGFKASTGSEKAIKQPLEKCFLWKGTVLPCHCLFHMISVSQTNTRSAHWCDSTWCGKMPKYKKSNELSNSISLSFHKIDQTTFSLVL